MKIGAKRVRPRAVPRSRVGSARDIEVLRSLAWAGYLSTAQIRRLHFPSQRTAQRRLRAALDHGLVRARLQGAALHLENVWTLTPKGAARLEALGTTDVRPGRVPRLQKLAHGLAVRDVFVAFVLAERAGAFQLKDFRFEEDLAGEPALRAAKLIPDGLAVVEAGGREVTAGVEVDLGSETSATLAAKFSVWRALIEAGPLRGTTLLVVAVREARATTLRRILQEVGLSADVVLLSELDAGTLASPFARPVRAERTGAATEPLEGPAVPG